MNWLNKILILAVIGALTGCSVVNGGGLGNNNGLGNDGVGQSNNDLIGEENNTVDSKGNSVAPDWATEIEDKYGVVYQGINYKIVSEIQEGVSFDGVIHTFRLPTEGVKVSSDYSKTPKTVASWREQKGNVDDRLVIAINGAYFHEDYSPSGHLKVGGKRIGERAFDEDRSGVFTVGENELISGVKIFDLADEGLGLVEDKSHSVQSYPFLIKDGEMAIKEDSGLIGRRSAIGMDEEGGVYLIFADERYLSLYRMMEELYKSRIAFTDVLNLDGGPSAGISFSETIDRRFNSQVSVPHVLYFEVEKR